MESAANHHRGLLKKESFNRFIIRESVDSQLSVLHADVIVKRFGFSDDLSAW